MENFEIRTIEECSSTTDELKTLAKKGQANPGLVLIAKRQTKGHGQYERSFDSPLGGLYMTIYTKKALPCDVSGLTLEIGRTIKTVIYEECGIECDIKLPNDILYKGKKLCGCLVESYSLDDSLNILVGIGLNINTKKEDFSATIKDIATSCYEITGRTFDVDTIAKAIIYKLEI